MDNPNGSFETSWSDLDGTSERIRSSMSGTYGEFYNTILFCNELDHFFLFLSWASRYKRARQCHAWSRTLPLSAIILYACYHFGLSDPFINMLHRKDVCTGTGYPSCYFDPRLQLVSVWQLSTLVEKTVLAPPPYCQYPTCLLVRWKRSSCGHCGV